MACSNRSSYGSSCSPSGIGCGSSMPQNCPDIYGCTNVCPDFTIRRFDNTPAFKVEIQDCDGPLDLSNLILEASMWAKGKLKKSIDTNDNYFSLADNIGFYQIMIGDVIIMDRPRSTEQMLVTGFDEDNFLILVQRGYNNSTIQNWKKGTPLKIMKFINNPAQTEMVYDDITNLDGTVSKDVLQNSYFIYDWQPNDTCLPGCYYLEFKLIKMADTPITPIVAISSDLCIGANPYPPGTPYGPPSNAVASNIANFVVVDNPSVISTISWTTVIPEITPFPSTISGTIVPSFTPYTNTPTSFGCGLGEGVETIRRFPVDSEGFLIQITNTVTSEN